MRKSYEVPSKSRLQAPHDHTNLILLRWPINNLWNLIPPAGDKWGDWLLWPLSQSLQLSPRNINDNVKCKLSQELLGQIIPSPTAWYIQWSKPTLCRTTQGHREKHNHLGLNQSMGPYNCIVKPQMDTRIANARVSLNLRHPKLGR